MIVDLFPTAVGIYDLHDINLEELKSVIESIETKDHTLVEGGVSSWNQNYPNDSYILNDSKLTFLKDTIQNFLNNYCIESSIAPVMITNSWHNIMPPGGKTARHRHTGVVSGAFYVEAESGTCPFIVHSPLQAHNAVMVKTMNGKYTSDTLGIDTVSGRLVLFPCWLEHETEVNKSKNNRIVISFNTMAVSVYNELKNIDIYRRG